jgi:hypothetical protein
MRRIKTVPIEENYFVQRNFSIREKSKSPLSEEEIIVDPVSNFREVYPSPTINLNKLTFKEFQCEVEKIKENNVLIKMINDYDYEICNVNNTEDLKNINLFSYGALSDNNCEITYFKSDDEFKLFIYNQF